VFRDTVQLNYLALPVDLAYALRADGQGLRVFAGGYVALFLNGRADGWSAGPRGTSRYTRAVQAAGAGPPQYGGYYAPRFDCGLQAGLGVRVGRVDLRAGYCRGFAIVAVEPQATGRLDGRVEGGRAVHHAWQFAVGFLFSLPKVPAGQSGT